MIRELTATGVTVSVETMRASAAGAAVSQGATIVNKISGGLADPELARVVAELGVTHVAMHWRGQSGRMPAWATYTNVVGRLSSELRIRLDAARRRRCLAGPGRSRPGPGLREAAQHDWELTRNLEVLQVLGRPLLVGASRREGSALDPGSWMPSPGFVAVSVGRRDSRSDEGFSPTRRWPAYAGPET